MRQPIFNSPSVVLGFCTLIIAIFALDMWLSEADKRQILLLFSFIPLRIGLTGATLEESLWAQGWSFITYAFLHGSWLHVLSNAAWFLVFGTPLARILSFWKFVLFCLLTAIFGALAHYLTYSVAHQPMIGASAIVSGVTAASYRFMFTQGEVLCLKGMIKNPTVRMMLSVWFVFNIGFGYFAVGSEMPIAWQAHIGGFLSGLLLFPLFYKAENHASLAPQMQEIQDDREADSQSKGQ